MPETASGGRRPMDEADVQAIIGRLGGAPALLEGREEFHEAVLRMNRERGALDGRFPGTDEGPVGSAFV